MISFMVSGMTTQMMMAAFNRNTSTEWKTVMQELTLHKEEAERLKEELEEVKQQFKHELELMKDQVIYCGYL